jgi:hypothetical protein
MEVVIAAIGGICTIFASVGAVVLDRRRNKEDEPNVKFHTIFNNINFWIKNEIPFTNYYHDYIHTFLIKRLKLIKKNIKKLINIDIKNTDYEYIVRKISELINGMNEFNDIQDTANYSNNIPDSFIKKFNKWDNRSDLIMIYYIKSIHFDSPEKLIYNFLNIYTASLNATINSLLSNLDILIDDVDSKSIIQDRFKKIVDDINKKTNLNDMIKSVLKDEKVYTYDKFLLRFNSNGIITYCSELARILDYNLEDILGININGIIQHEINNSFDDIFTKIRDNNGKYYDIVIKQILDDSKLNMVFLV